MAKISIHAPVKGATQGFQGVSYAPLISIHAPVKGATASSPWLSVPSPRFQSTHP